MITRFKLLLVIWSLVLIVVYCRYSGVRELAQEREREFPLAVALLPPVLLSPVLLPPVLLPHWD